MLKAAVIGVGSIGQNHARVYREMDGAQLVGVTDANAGTAAKIGNRLNVPFYTDINKLLEEQKPDLGRDYRKTAQAMSLNQPARDARRRMRQPTKPRKPTAAAKTGSTAGIGTGLKVRLSAKIPPGSFDCPKRMDLMSGTVRLSVTIPLKPLAKICEMVPI